MAGRSGAAASGVTTTRTYTDDGLLATVTVDDSTVTFQYDEAGNQVLTQYPDGTTEERTFDALGRVTQIVLRNGTTILNLHAYEYDQVGNPVRVVQNGVQHYAVYDDKNQLTDWCAQDPCGATTPGLHYTYDPAGNRLTETRDGATTTYTYDNRNRLTAVTAADETVRQMEYDDAGRLIVDGERHYQYDVLGRLTSVTEPGNDTITYTYTADGLVSERTV